MILTKRVAAYAACQFGSWGQVDCLLGWLCVHDADMSPQAKLHQLSILFHPEQDRLLLRVKLNDLSEFRFWLTRRFVRLFSPGLIQVQQAGLPGTSQQVAAIAEFQQEQAMAGANFQDQFNEKVSAYPLGEEPILLSQYKFETLPNALYRLTLMPEKGEGVHISIDKDIASMLSKLLEDALAVSEWDISVHVNALPQLSSSESDTLPLKH